MYSKILNIFPIPKKENVETNNNDKYRKIENEIGFKFPNDYKEFIDIYGAGNINEFMWILSPFQENKNLNLVKKLNDMKIAYEIMQNEFPDKYTMHFYKNGTGLIPWGLTDNGDELYWNILTNSYTIVVFQSRYAEIYEYKMEFTEFIYKLLKRKIKCNAFPEDFFCGNMKYNSVDLI